MFEGTYGNLEGTYGNLEGTLNVKIVIYLNSK